MSTKPWILVSPASRGIGLALTRYLLRRTEAPILATYRKDPEEMLKAIGQSMEGENPNMWKRLHTVRLDVTQEDTFIAAGERAAELFNPAKYHLHLAYSIPGILHVEKSPQDINWQNAHDTFAVNSIGPLMYIKYFERFLPKKNTTFEVTEGLRPDMALMILMSARVGSITDNGLGGWYSYRASKAAVTQLAKTFDHHLRLKAGDKAGCIAMHPGTVRTQFTEGLIESYEKAGRVLSPHEAATKLVQRVLDMDPSRRGGFLDWKGKMIPP